MLTKEHLARVRWNCRRGMLELDVLLENFFDQHYQHLTSAEQQLFEKLLLCADQDIYGWLMGKQKPENKELENIVMRIRANSKN